jgi:hypothetical protein
MPDNWYILKEFLFMPKVFFLLFMWICCSIVSIRTFNLKPMTFIFILTFFMMLFKKIPY